MSMKRALDDAPFAGRRGLAALAALAHSLQEAWRPVRALASATLAVKGTLVSALAAMLLFPFTCAADILLAGVTEARGVGAAAGTSFRSGYTIAIDEINAAGGLLGHKLVLRQFDIDTNPQSAAAGTDSAMAVKPFAILGPVFSGLTMEAMKRTDGTSVPHFTGGEAASISSKFHRSLLRTSLDQQGAMPRLAAFAVYGLGAKRLAVLWIDNEFGRNGLRELMKATELRGGRVVFQAGVPPGATEFRASVRQALAARPDALVLYLNESESVEALKSVRAFGTSVPVIGDGPLVSSKVVEAAGAEAEGVLAHTSISVDLDTPEMQRFVALYKSRFGGVPDHNSVKGYFAVQTIKVGLLRAGKVDPALFLDTVKSGRFGSKENPALMTTFSYDYFGNLNRESYFVQIQGGRARILARMLSTDSSFLLTNDGRRLALTSDEARRVLRDSVQQRKSAGSGRDWGSPLLGVTH
jgi:branched-chain amino acid transport system substrate-binding protein